MIGGRDFPEKGQIRPMREVKPDRGDVFRFNPGKCGKSFPPHVIKATRRSLHGPFANGGAGAWAAGMYVRPCDFFPC